MQPSLVVPGSLLAGRYLLVDALDMAPSGGAGSAGGAWAGTDEPHWRARDELLRRAVAIHLVRPGPDATRVLDGARAAARLLGTSFVRVLDVLDAQHLHPSEAGDLAGLVVTEWVPGEDLEVVLLRDGPLDDARVRQLGITLGDALAAISSLGDPDLPMPALTPADVLLTADGARVALDRHWGAPPSGASPAQRCAAVTYAALTARWPLGGSSVALEAPAGEPGRVSSPAHVRAHISHELDELVSRCMGHTGEPEPTASQLAGLFRALPAPAPPAGAEPEPARRRWLAPAAVGTLLAVGFGLLGWQVTRAVQHDPGERVRPGKPVARASATATPTPTPTPSALPVATATGFDPLGNGTEGRGELAIDSDPATGWRTVAYLHRPDLGGLKSGVGLVLDLGAVRMVDGVELDFATGGASVQLFPSTAQPTVAPTGTPAAATDSAGTVTHLTMRPAAEARYLTVWLTRLPPALDRADAYRAEIDDVRVTGTTP